MIPQGLIQNDVVTAPVSTRAFCTRYAAPPVSTALAGPNHPLRGGSAAYRIASRLRRNWLLAASTWSETSSGVARPISMARSPAIVDDRAHLISVMYSSAGCFAPYGGKVLSKEDDLEAVERRSVWELT